MAEPAAVKVGENDQSFQSHRSMGVRQLPSSVCSRDCATGRADIRRRDSQANTGLRGPRGSFVRQTDAPKLVPQADGILEEHRQLHGYLEKVEAALSATQPPEAAAVRAAGLAPTLGG